MTENEILWGLLWEQLRKLSNKDKASILHFMFGAMEHNSEFIQHLKTALEDIKRGTL